MDGSSVKAPPVRILIFSYFPISTSWVCIYECYYTSSFDVIQNPMIHIIVKGVVLFFKELKTVVNLTHKKLKNKNFLFVVTIFHICFPFFCLWLRRRIKENNYPTIHMWKGRIRGNHVWEWLCLMVVAFCFLLFLLLTIFHFLFYDME
jgi:ABC-type Fe3+ transport system permease subunit